MDWSKAEKIIPKCKLFWIHCFWNYTWYSNLASISRNWCPAVLFPVTNSLSWENYNKIEDRGCFLQWYSKSWSLGKKKYFPDTQWSRYFLREKFSDTGKAICGHCLRIWKVDLSCKKIVWKVWWIYIWEIPKKLVLFKKRWSNEGNKYGLFAP